MTTEGLAPRSHSGDSGTTADALLQDFIGFPAALALLDPGGRLEMANANFWRRFGEAGVRATSCEALSPNVGAQWRQLTLPMPGGLETSARAVRMTHHILLMVDEPPASEPAVDTLKHRLADLAHLTATDSLTGAWNRAHFAHVIELELSRSLATRLPVTLILLDIDHFKAVNDSFGHPAGDQVLRELTRRVRKHLRGSDLLFRWDGQQFVVLAANAGHRRGETIAEKVRDVVASHEFPHIGRLTVSLGVAEHDGAEATYSWFERLDAALQRAKRAGRNRVVVDCRGNSDRWAAQGAGGLLHLQWQEGYECGERVIDEQHRELFRLANNLIDASLQNRTTAEQIATPLDEVIAHVQRHFADEEAILERLAYTDLTEHRRAHAALIRRALQMKAMLEANQVQVGAIVEFLAQDVAARHLLGVDAAFFPVIRTLRRRS